MTAVFDLFKALGDPIRLRIVEMLARNGEMCVCEITEELEMTQPAVSHHLAKLKNLGLLEPRKDGQWVHYSLNADILENHAIAYLNRLVENLKSAPQRKVCCKKKVG